MVMVIVIAAFPLGFLLRNRLAAFVAFGLAFSYVFTFQTAQLVLEATHGSDEAFGDLSDPDWDWFGDTIGYLVFTTAVYAVGLALVAAGHLVRIRRARQLEEVSHG